MFRSNIYLRKLELVAGVFNDFPTITKCVLNAVENVNLASLMSSQQAHDKSEKGTNNTT